MSVDWNKPIQTRDGRPASNPNPFYSPKGCSCMSVSYRDTDGTFMENIVCDETGRVHHEREDDLDIVNVPEPFISSVDGCWSNVWQRQNGSRYLGLSKYDTREEAKSSAVDEYGHTLLGQAQLPTTLTVHP